MRERLVHVEHAAFEPHTRQLEPLLESSSSEGLARRGQAEREHVPADHLGSRGKLEAHAVGAPGRVVGDGLQRQPLQSRALGDASRQCLLRRLAGAAVEARGTRRGDERMRLGLYVDGDLQTVAADDAARRMHQHVMADAGALGIEAREHAQRTVVPVAGDGARVLCVVAVGEFEVAVPAHGWSASGPEAERVQCRSARRTKAMRVAPSGDPNKRAPSKGRCAATGRSPALLRGALRIPCRARRYPRAPAWPSRSTRASAASR
jgi:hypothetical protein